MRVHDDTQVEIDGDVARDIDHRQAEFVRAVGECFIGGIDRSRRSRVKGVARSERCRTYHRGLPPLDGPGREVGVGGGAGDHVALPRMVDPRAASSVPRPGPCCRPDVCDIDETTLPAMSRVCASIWYRVAVTRVVSQATP